MLAFRSLAFNVLVPLWTAVMAIALSPVLVLPSKGPTLAGVRFYMQGLGVLERWVVGIRTRRLAWDKLPAGPCIVAAKHQSMWETMKIHLWLDDPAIILKRELLWIPLWGWYARKLDLIAVDRRAGRRAVDGLVTAAREVIAQGRPIVIFPQGTRIAPGAYRPYKVGVFAIYEALGLPVVPIALNSGVCWGRKTFYKRPGTITAEVQDAIPPGLDRTTFLAELERRIEVPSERLTVDAGGPETDWPAPGAGPDYWRGGPGPARMETTAPADS